MRRWVVFAAGCALTLAVAACGSPDGGGGIKGGIKGAVKAAGGPPPGGWPQPVNGELTPRMCGLLTDADYARYGHQRLAVGSEKRLDDQPNAVGCLYMTDDELDLGLQPTAEAATVAYATTLKDHKERLSEDRRPTILASNVVPGADESWFDYWTLGTADAKFKEYEIRVRRGSLLVGIVLSGIHGKNEKDPRTVLTGLAGLVLQRVPNVGRTDTGKTTKVEYAVAGSGRARQIIYYDPSASKSVTLKNVRLPWHVSKPLVSVGAPFVMLNLSALSGGTMGAIGCDISVDGRTVTEQRPQPGMATCMKSYTPPK